MESDKPSLFGERRLTRQALGVKGKETTRLGGSAKKRRSEIIGGVRGKERRSVAADGC